MVKQSAKDRTKDSAKTFNQQSKTPAELHISELSHPCGPISLAFQNTNELPDLESVIGQPRALRALELGSEVSGLGYNIFVLGIPGSGRTTLSREYLERQAASEPVPNDWCYVNNFNNPRAPRVLELPAGNGNQLRKDMHDLVTFCQREIPRTFASKEFIQERERLAESLQQYQEAEFKRLQDHAQDSNFLVMRTPFGIVLAPGADGKPSSPEDLDKLSPDQRDKLNQLQKNLGSEVEKTIKRLRDMGNEISRKLEELTTRTVSFVIGPSLDAIKSKYADFISVLSYLESVQADIIANATQFKQDDISEKSTFTDLPLHHRTWLVRYSVNLLVDNSQKEGAPVIIETHPVYHNLLGRIEHEVVMGATQTDFTMIRPGAFHHANGGYLILPARDVLINPYAWEGVKRVLRDNRIRIVEIGSQLGLLSTESLDPEPIPLKIKVLLVGTPLLYYLLQEHDEDFAKLFKVRAEFATTMERSSETEAEYGLFVKSVVDQNKLPPFDNTAVARIIEFSSRLAEDQHKLSTRFGKITDLIREAAFWANKGKETEKEPYTITHSAVQRAIDEAIYRTNLIDERMVELIAHDTIMIAVSGSVIGQINALSVISLGDISFGRPNRLTASVSPGKAGVVDIERQAKLGGPIHTKGILILNGFLHGRYGSAAPLSLTASLTFEQSYSEVDGDSASAAELLALLSAIAEAPLKQGIAVTGSINQHGQIQAIGSVNEKIEGFFKTCTAKGLTGKQGVLIPKANKRNLMLRKDIIEAVDDRRFHIWCFDTIDKGFALLTGLDPGAPLNDGSYPEDTLNHLVMDRLSSFANALSTAKNEEA